MPRPIPLFVCAAIVVASSSLGCSSDTPAEGDPGPAYAAGGGHFYYERDGKVFRLQASAGAQPENVSVKLGSGKTVTIEDHDVEAGKSYLYEVTSANNLETKSAPVRAFVTTALEPDRRI